MFSRSSRQERPLQSCGLGVAPGEPGIPEEHQAKSGWTGAASHQNSEYR